MNWKKAIADYRMYLKIERGLSESSIESYTLDVLSFEQFLIDENIKKKGVEGDLPVKRYCLVQLIGMNYSQKIN